MPPKKKGGGKKGKGKGKKGKKGKGKKRIDDIAVIPVETMSNSELLDKIKLMREELEREREERNYFQLERDKINTFWEITKRQLGVKRTELRTRDRELEDAEEKHQNEIKVYKQKVKHLLYEHQSSISQMKAESVVNMKTMTDKHNLSELELRKDKRALKLEVKDKEMAHSNVITDLKKKHEEDISNLEMAHKLQLHETETIYQKKMGELREELALRHKMVIHELEERKNQHINTLIRNHEKELLDAQNFYNDITLNNISLINSLRDQVEEIKMKESRMQKDMKELEEENDRLVAPLERTRKKVGSLKAQLANYEKDKEQLRIMKARVNTLSRDLQAIKWERELLEQGFKKAQLERDDLYRQFVTAIQEVQQKCSFKNLLLEKKLAALVAMLEKKDAQLNEVVTLSKVDPTSLSVITGKLEDVLDSKNSAIKDLQYELARVCKAHKDLLRTCKAKLSQFGIPKENLGFKPLEHSVSGPVLGLGPAGVVSAPT